jgi:hypothetical protein
MQSRGARGSRSGVPSRCHGTSRRSDTQWRIAIGDRPGNQLLEHLPGWRRAFGNDVATIFVHERALARPSKSD